GRGYPTGDRYGERVPGVAVARGRVDVAAPELAAPERGHVAVGVGRAQYLPKGCDGRACHGAERLVTGRTALVVARVPDLNRVVGVGLARAVIGHVDVV